MVNIGNSFGYHRQWFLPMLGYIAAYTLAPICLCLKQATQVPRKRVPEARDEGNRYRRWLSKPWRAGYQYRQISCL